MGDYGYVVWILVAMTIMLFAWFKRWGTGWDSFARNPTTVQEAVVDWLIWVVPVLIFAMAIRNALVWLGMPAEWEAALWVMFIAYAGVRGIDYGKIAWSLRGVIATQEEMTEGVSVEEILRAAQQGKEQG